MSHCTEIWKKDLESVLWNFHQVYTTMYYSLTVNIRFRDINYFVISDSSQNVVQGWIFFIGDMFYTALSFHDFGYTCL